MTSTQCESNTTILQKKINSKLTRKKKRRLMAMIGFKNSLSLGRKREDYIILSTGRLRMKRGYGRGILKKNNKRKRYELRYDMEKQARKQGLGEEERQQK